MSPRSSLLPTAALLAGAPLALAADGTWNAPVSGLFTDPARWVSGLVPGAGDAATFGASPSATPFDVALPGAASLRALHISTQAPHLHLAAATLTISQDAVVGIGAGSSASLTLSNGSLSTASLTVPAAGASGELVLSAATLTTASLSCAAAGASSSGSIALSAAQLIVSTPSTASFGDGATTQGTLTLDAASTMTLSSAPLFVGRRGGSAAVTILAGSSLSVAGPAGIAVDVDPGSGEPSNADISVIGAGSSFTTDADLTIAQGNLSHGSLSMSAGGASAALSALCAPTANASCEVGVTGAGSTWTITNALTMGGAGAASILVSGGASVSCDSAVLGADPDSYGAASIAGPGTRWSTTQTLEIGRDGFGLVSIRDGAIVECGSAAIGSSEQGHGEITIVDAGSEWLIDSSLVVGLGNSAPSSLTLGAAALVTCDTLEIAAGSLVAGAGAIQAGVSITNAGRLHAGHLSPGTLSLTTLEQLASGRVEIELDDEAVSRLAVSGYCELRGTLAFSITPDFAPALNDAFTVLTGAPISGAFDAVTGQDLGNGRYLAVSTSASAVIATVLCSADFNPDGEINSNDVVAYLNQFFADLADGTLIADFDRNGETNSNDVASFLNAWFTQLANGC